MPFTIGQSRASDIFSHQLQLSDTVTWSRGRHALRIGGNVVRHTSGGTGSEPGTAILGTFTFRTATTAPFDQLTLADVQTYTQPIDFGIDSYELKQWLYTGFVQDSIRVHRDLTRRPRPALRPPDPHRRHQQPRARASASAGIRAATRGPPIRGGYAHVLHADPVQRRGRATW